MKKTVLMAALLAAPTITFAGGGGHMGYQDMMDRAMNHSNVAPAAANEFGSSEDPASIVESRQISGSENENYVRYSFSFIPQSYWEEVSGYDLSDVNGLIELEEYLGETRREVFTPGEDLNREDDRQERAKNKALRLRSITGN